MVDWGEVEKRNAGTRQEEIIFHQPVFRYKGKDYRAMCVYPGSNCQDGTNVEDIHDSHYFHYDFDRFVEAYKKAGGKI